MYVYQACPGLLALIYFPLVDAEFDRALLFFIDEQRSSSYCHSALTVLSTSAGGGALISGRIEINCLLHFASGVPGSPSPCPIACPGEYGRMGNPDRTKIQICLFVVCSLLSICDQFEQKEDRNVAEVSVFCFLFNRPLYPYPSVARS